GVARDRSAVGPLDPDELRDTRMSVQPDHEVMFERGQRVRVRAAGVPEFATIRFALPGDEPGSWDLILVDDQDRRHEVNLAAGDTQTLRPLVSDGRGGYGRVRSARGRQWRYWRA